MTSVVLISDERITGIPAIESGEALADLETVGISAEGRQYVRAGLAERLALAQTFLPTGVRLHVVEGLRPLESQQKIYAGYLAEVKSLNPDISDAEAHTLASRFVSPVEVAPHVAGAAVDLTLIGENGPYDLGTPIDATPEQSNGACFFDATNISREARTNRSLLADVLTSAGLVNYPTEWWHWSFGDRYWAYCEKQPNAIYGPTVAPELSTLSTPAE
ncbi:D-alanyl-D-alanine dipeptidase [Kribbella voronezhensis]|uniref:D-alanyl-D-alanine dipeptidase n=1 Tax=Kribbella voronezhensis TaxID=2512212 RepID=A0A4R7TCS0_9ACTN|nr:M15 family metallopeptidase [Kribbella voronezhensis]TDU89107.1 D-alanyl-D-alanine dipeptidase [Kribbella voronezhensis]